MFGSFIFCYVWSCMKVRAKQGRGNVSNEVTMSGGLCVSGWCHLVVTVFLKVFIGAPKILLDVEKKRKLHWFWRVIIDGSDALNMLAKFINVLILLFV